MVGKHLIRTASYSLEDGCGFSSLRSAAPPNKNSTFRKRQPATTDLPIKASILVNWPCWKVIYHAAKGETMSLIRLEMSAIRHENIASSFAMTLTGHCPLKRTNLCLFIPASCITGAGKSTLTFADEGIFPPSEGKVSH